MDSLTLFSDRLAAAPEIDETDLTITNTEFLTAIFIGLEADERPMIVSVAGTINCKTTWPIGTSWSSELTADNGSKNNYFTLSTFLSKNGNYRRQKGQFSRAFGVMADDIGTKALPRKRLDACPPSYLIETSLGNYQAGYLFVVPCADLKVVEALQDALVEANLCDSGAKGPSARIGRLPNGVNGKYSPAQVCRLVEWHPERRYTINEIVDRLELIPPKAAGRASLRKVTPTERSLVDGVYLPRLDENEVVTAHSSKAVEATRVGWEICATSHATKPDSGLVNKHSGVVNGDSGHYPKTFTIGRNPCSR